MNIKGCLNFATIFVVVSCSVIERQESTSLPYPSPNPYLAQGRKFALATQGPYSSAAGKKMFEQGGNAIDAAVAMSFALAVERPQSTGIGGGGFMVFHIPGKGVKTIDFREMAPRKAHRDMYLDKAGNVIDKASLEGELASGVPGMVSGLFEVHRQYGKLPWSKVLLPAQELAKEGFIIYSELAKALEEKEQTLKKFPSTEKIFFNRNGELLKEGDLLVQADLANTIKVISKTGLHAFYRGEIAQKIVSQFMQTQHITAKDLQLYRPKWRRPLKKIIKGKEIYSMGPPSSGGVHVLQILKMMEAQPLKEWGARDWRSIHWGAQSMQAAFSDRAEFLGDADFVKVPVSGLLSDPYLQQRVSKFSIDKVLPQVEVPPGDPFPYESHETAHLTVMDSQGWAVTSTQTINGFFGSGLVVDGAGFFMNNEMDDFSVKPGVPNLFGAIGGEKNAVAAGKRPLSSMSPTVVMENGKPLLAIGSPSGTRIITCVAQVLANRLIFDMPLDQAMSFSRYHHQWAPDILRIEEPYWPQETMSKLEQIGYKFEKKPLGCRVQAVEIGINGELNAVSDLRGLGKAIGE